MENYAALKEINRKTDYAVKAVNNIVFEKYIFAVALLH
jgi:hypothetical protein